jgi:hypothetical protein
LATAGTMYRVRCTGATSGGRAPRGNGGDGEQMQRKEIGRRASTLQRPADLQRIGDSGYNRAMCGRFSLRANPRAVATLFDLPSVPDLAPRYNVSPTQPVAVVGTKPGGQGRGLVMMRWGLVPRWSKGDRPSAHINARSETGVRPANRVLAGHGRHASGR